MRQNINKVQKHKYSVKSKKLISDTFDFGESSASENCIKDAN